MSWKRSIDEIQRMGFEWLRYPLLEELCIKEGDQVDLGKTLERLETKHAYYEQQINEAYRFKMNSGADYSDFTDRFDDHIKMKSDLAAARSYLIEIIEAAE
jgi:hypothetical protein